MVKRKRVVSEWDRLTQLIGYYVLTGYVEGNHAQSVLLVGAPGAGKSSLVKRFHRSPRSTVVLDLTVDGLRRNLLPEAKKKGWRTVLMPEFYKPFQRQGPVAMNMVGLLTAVMSGEVERILIGPDGLEYKDVQLGIVGAMTSQVYSEWSKTAAATGVLDRMSVLPITFSKRERVRIENQILNCDKRDLEPVKWDWPREPVAIKWDRALKKRLLLLCGQILTEDRNRLLDQLMSLSQAIALYDGKRRVMQKHVRELESYLDFLKNIKPQRGG